MPPSASPNTRYHIRHLHQPQGWLSPAWLEVDVHGVIARVEASQPADWDSASVVKVDAWVVPGVPNVHSHAFQRAMAGLTEQGHPQRPEDSFWTWRTTMYRFAQLLTPEELQVIGAWLYVEMLKSGMTSVGEFHYLHHAPDGSPYLQREEMALRLMHAATESGIRMTMLPVFYAHAGIGLPPAPHHARFVHASPDAFLTLVDALQTRARLERRITVGIAPHSLRAVSSEELRALHLGVPAGTRIHIHVAEQPAEVTECMEKLGQRPVQHLLEHHGADDQWCLVHATHLTAAERTGLACSGAVAGLCPTTEANLGDGLFPAVDYLREGGVMAIGSDSHISVDAAEELRLLEYGQRLTHGRRNLLLDGQREDHWSVGRHLFDRCVQGGARALGHGAAFLVPGAVADLVVLNPDHPSLVVQNPATVLDAWVFAHASGTPVRDVMVGGQWVVRDGHHVREAALLSAFNRVMQSLKERL